VVDDFDLSCFPGVTRLFPLPGVVLFPHVAIPLHIFEPRYRQMTEHALAGDRLITLVQIRADADWKTDPKPPLEPVGCLGRIIQHERLADGRFNVLLAGLRRVELTRELAAATLYRQAQVAIWEDVEANPLALPLITELVARFKALASRQGPLDPDIKRLLDSERSLGSLTDILAHALPLPGDLKQAFLVERDPDRRARKLLAILNELTLGDGVGSSRYRSPAVPYPPPISLN
jgi:Lon protease-like protein